MGRKQPPASEIHEELSAYLDGELDMARRRQIEERLTRDAVYRQELQQLQGAWDLLDSLPKAAAHASFSRTTLELVAAVAAGEAKTAQPRWARAGFGLLIAGGVLVALSLGLLAGRWYWPDPNAALLRDLPVLENLDEYQQADNLEFLKALKRNGVFDEDGERES